MERRTLLGRLAAVATGGLAAGCTSAGEVPVTAPSGPEELPATKTEFQYEGDSGNSGDDDSNPFTSTEWDFFAGEEGNLVISVSVANSGDIPHTGLVEVYASTNEEEWTKEQYLTLMEGEIGTVRFHFSVDYQTFNTSSPDIRIRFPEGTPRTDLPTESTTGSATSESTPTRTDEGDSTPTET
jgi:hypothetical protein